MKITELENYLNKLLNIHEYKDYCPNGLQVQGKKEIKRIAFSVSASLESIKKASEWKADALVVHHGIFWNYKGVSPLVGAHYKRVSELIKSDINLLAYHLPLDGHLELGNAAGIAEKLNLTNIKNFAEYKRSYIGVSGSFTKPLSAIDLKRKLKEILGHEIILASFDEKKLIQSIGIATGGANNHWEDARKLGLDAFLTGEISEYNWHDAIEGETHYFAGGHHATERFGVLKLQEKLKDQFETLFIDSPNIA